MGIPGPDESFETLHRPDQMCPHSFLTACVSITKRYDKLEKHVREDSHFPNCDL